ncbi:hypothetical protein [Bdellovibrio sp. BCCA]|uniref:hypothetical protein n=1 Tax=Bdellovibrio sp. BCCA TaxID=3136281 RepID=UPI0030F0F8F0
MKKLILAVLSVTTASSISNAYIIQGTQRAMTPQEETCSMYLYQKLSTHESKTDLACMQGRTDFQFRDCTIGLTNDLDSILRANGGPHPDNVIYASQACLYSNGRGDREFRNCTLEFTKNISKKDFDTAGLLCSRNETRSQVQQCTLSLSRYLVGVTEDRNFDYRSYALGLCQGTINPSYSSCVIDLYSRGGQEIENSRLATDAHRLCRNNTNQELNKCIISAYNNDGLSGVQAARVCLEKFDPVAKARREAELRRIEEDKRRQAEEARRAAEQRAAEQRRLDEQRRQEEQRRQSADQQQQRTQEQKRQEELRRQQEEQRKKDEEARKKKEEEEKKKQQEQQKQPSNPPANNGGGVIVDLPAFE